MTSCNKRPMCHIAHMRNKTHLHKAIWLNRNSDFFFQDKIILILKLESPSPRDTLCQVWLKLAHCFWRRALKNFANVFSLFRYHLLLEKDVALHLNKLESPSPMMLCAKFCWNWPSSPREEDGWKCEKFTDGQMTRKVRLSFQLMRAKSFEV